MIHERKYYPNTRFPANDYAFKLSPEGKLCHSPELKHWRAEKFRADRANLDYCLLFVDRHDFPSKREYKKKLDAAPIPKSNLHNTKPRRTEAELTQNLEESVINDPEIMRGRYGMGRIADRDVPTFLAQLRKTQKKSRISTEVNWQSSLAGGSVGVYDYGKGLE